MTKEEQSKLVELGERMVRMEVMLDTLIKSNELNSQQRKEQAAKLDKITAEFNKLRGAKWAFFSLIAVSASVGGLMVKVIPFFTK